MSLQSQPTMPSLPVPPGGGQDWNNRPPPPQPGGARGPGDNGRRRLVSPLGIFVLALLGIFGVAGYGLGVSVTKAANNSATNYGSTLNPGGTSTKASTYPKATENQGNQLAQFTTDPDGAKHFTFTAKNVQWQVLQGQWIDAYTLDGTVPGPEIHVVAGDHVRITINNKLDEATTLHWHGVEVPSSQDGVPNIDQAPIQPGTSFTYDFTIHDDNYGTYAYHSHFDDVKQVSEGLYGAFIIDPKPGTAAAAAEPKVQHDVLQILNEIDGYYTINGHSYPDTEVIHIKHGDTIRVRLINLGEMIHPMHLHGHDFTVFARDGARQASPDVLNTITIAPGETADFTFYAWANPGDVYPFHCHIMTHVMNPGQNMADGNMGGLVTLFQYDK